MALQAGDDSASSGMSKSIYDAINGQLSGSIKPPESLTEIQKSWKRLAFAIATGVIASIKSDMEIVGIQASGDFTAKVTGKVEGSGVTGESKGSVTTKQTGVATGHVS